MQEGQLPLFQRKSFPAVLQQVMPVVRPTGEATILQTLPAYHAYLRSGGYSKYTPDDFTGDVKRLGLYLRDKQIQAITPEDIQQWTATLKQSLSEKTVSRKVTAINNYFLWLCRQGILAKSPTEYIYNT